jgi:hypothetical protein
MDHIHSSEGISCRDAIGGNRGEETKEGINNVSLAYILHVHQSDYKMMKMLLVYAKEMDLWHKHWGILYY